MIFDKFSFIGETTCNYVPASSNLDLLMSTLLGIKDILHKPTSSLCVKTSKH